MYIYSLFLLLFWCVGWAELDFLNGLWLVLLLLSLMLINHTRQIALFSLIVFLLASAGQYSLTNKQFPKSWTGIDLRLNACISSLKSTDHGLSLILKNPHIQVPIIKQERDNRLAKPIYQAQPIGLLGRVKVTVYPFAKAAQPPINSLGHAGFAGLIGKKATLVVRLKGANNYHNPHSYDYVRWTALNGQIASGYVKQWIVTEGDCSGVNWPEIWIAKVRQQLWQDLQNYAHSKHISKITVALWGGLVLGQSSALNSQQWQVLAATGTTHLLVISGLHVGLVAVLVMLIVRLMLIPFNIKSSLGIRLGAWSGLIAALFFALISGFGLPAQRAVIMLTGLMWGFMWGLQLSFTQRLFIAFFVTLVLQPTSVSSLGFWLSYTAVFALGLVWYRGASRAWWSRVMHLLAAQGALSVLLLPVIAIGTGHVSVLGPLVNMILVPLFSAVLIPTLLLVSIVLRFVDLPNFFFIVIDITLSTLWQGLEFLSEISWAQIFVGSLPIEGFVSVLITGCLCLIIRRWHWPILFLWLPLAGFMIFELARNNALDHGVDNSQQRVVITVLDVGQGLSVWVRQGKHNMVYDLGNSYKSGFSLVDAVILPEMLAQGVTKLETLVVSHWDMDHSGGMEEMLKRQKVQHLILPSESKITREPVFTHQDVEVSRCVTKPWEKMWFTASKSLMWRQISLADYGLTGNNASCVILLDIHGRQVLIAGDIESKAESVLLAKLDQLDISTLSSDVLIAPHHGSKTSSTKAFLAQVMPAYVLISAGKNNPYGHPHKRSTHNYWQSGAQWYNTGRHGQIRLVFETNGDYQVTPYKK